MIMGKRITGASWAWLTALGLVTPFLTATAFAGDGGTLFRPVAAKDCASVGSEAACLGAPLVSGSAATALDVSA